MFTAHCIFADLFAEPVADGNSCYIPEVASMASVANWLSMDAYEQVARDINCMPADIQRILQDCCLCVYSKT